MCLTVLSPTINANPNTNFTTSNIYLKDRHVLVVNRNMHYTILPTISNFDSDFYFDINSSTRSRCHKSWYTIKTGRSQIFILRYRPLHWMAKALAITERIIIYGGRKYNSLFITSRREGLGLPWSDFVEFWDKGGKESTYWTYYIPACQAGLCGGLFGHGGPGWTSRADNADVSNKNVSVGSIPSPRNHLV